jgi:hypothetical protein
MHRIRIRESSRSTDYLGRKGKSGVFLETHCWVSCRGHRIPVWSSLAEKLNGGSIDFDDVHGFELKDKDGGPVLPFDERQIAQLHEALVRSGTRSCALGARVPSSIRHRSRRGWIAGMTTSASPAPSHRGEWPVAGKGVRAKRGARVRSQSRKNGLSRQRSHLRIFGYVNQRRAAS